MSYISALQESGGTVEFAIVRCVLLPRASVVLPVGLSRVLDLDLALLGEPDVKGPSRGGPG